MATKKESSAEHLSELRVKIESVKSRLVVGQRELFKLTPVAKIGNSEFEIWRKKCAELTKEYLMLEREIEKAEKGLGR